MSCTIGYEEAAAQGLVAGVNAARVAASSSVVTFPRENSYLGTLINDLVTKVHRARPPSLYGSTSLVVTAQFESHASSQFVCWHASQVGVLAPFEELGCQGTLQGMPFA